MRCWNDDSAMTARINRRLSATLCVQHSIRLKRSRERRHENTLLVSSRPQRVDARDSSLCPKNLTHFWAPPLPSTRAGRKTPNWPCMREFMGYTVTVLPPWLTTPLRLSGHRQGPERAWFCQIYLVHREWSVPMSHLRCMCNKKLVG